MESQRVKYDLATKQQQQKLVISIPSGQNHTLILFFLNYQVETKISEDGKWSVNFISLFPIDCKTEYFLSCFQTLPEGGLLHGFKQS